ncbi:unnamed protein product [Adineta steineri]|uniref:DUF5672 domain-containing protein n=1 Tax=Adineta steineri TaxID=433720 RepID=A0A819S8J9_9BILA|nr:unnamed protein product [Adineta steineri]CAF4058006.1 unnamed protein product [Adineta steineri]
MTRIEQTNHKILRRRLCFLCSCVFIVALTIISGLFGFYFFGGSSTIYSTRPIPTYSPHESRPKPLFLKNRTETTSKQYAVFACSISAPVAAYCFYTPIITFAWRRLGYQAIVIFVGDFKALNGTQPDHIRLAAEWITRFDGIVHYFQCDEAYAIKISQTIRVFIGFLPLPFINDDDFLLTTDSDLLPLRREQYMLRTDYPDGFIVNRWCCGTFKMRNKTYHMFPMGHLHIKRKVWRAMVLESTVHQELVNMTSKQGNQAFTTNETSLVEHESTNKNMSLLLDEAPLSFASIAFYLRYEFGEIYDQTMLKGDQSWDMDQKLITMFLLDYWNTTTEGQKLKIDERPLMFIEPNVNNMDMSNTNSSNKSSLYPGVAVLINNRTDLNIPSRILNVLMHIPNTWPVQIIHSTSNYEYLIQSNDLKPYIDNGRIILTKLFDEKLFSLPNKLFTAIQFYELIPGEKILIFQLDSLFCSNSPHKITDYLQYDYIGAPWGITSKSGMVGNSGFSLRTRSKTIELLTNHPYDLSTNEDLWFASNYHLVNANIPTTEIAATFSVETQYYPKPLGVHMPGNYLNMKDYTNLCIQCPELRMIWPYCQDKEKIPSQEIMNNQQATTMNKTS